MKDFWWELFPGQARRLPHSSFRPTGLSKSTARHDRGQPWQETHPEGGQQTPLGGGWRQGWDGPGGPHDGRGPDTHHTQQWHHRCRCLPGESWRNLEDCELWMQFDFYIKNLIFIINLLSERERDIWLRILLSWFMNFNLVKRNSFIIISWWWLWKWLNVLKHRTS